MKAIVLCGGEGSRLRPYTDHVPKPMLPLGDKPILEYVLLNAKKHGVRDFYLTVGYKKEQIMEYFGNGEKLGIHIEYSVEEEKMDTAGSILPLKEKMNETFFVLMGDHLTNINLRKIFEFHKKKGKIATIAVKRKPLNLHYGIVNIKEDDVVSFEEKPRLEFFINAGIYVFEPEIFEYIRGKEDFAKHVFPRLLREGRKIAAYKMTEFWMDIGTLADYEKVNEVVSIANTAFSLLEGT